MVRIKINEVLYNRFTIMPNRWKKEFNTFEDIKYIDEFGNEYWCARELQKVLEYSQWRNCK